MAELEDGSWKEFLNSHVKIIYDDCGNFPSKKEGILVAENPTHLIIRTGGSHQAILKSRVIRVELK